MWINTQANHPKEITPETERAVYELMSCGINDDVVTFRELHLKPLRNYKGATTRIPNIPE